MLNDNGIAWMIGGGVKAESGEDQRRVLHRLAVTGARPSVGDQVLHLRERVATIVGRRLQRTEVRTLSADCCPA